ncbi:MAG: hypothetical protein RIR51_1164 [Bacteroidota bacterium]
MTRLLYNWNIIRIVKLAFGVYALFEAYTYADWMIGALASYLVITSLFNIGCAGGSCSIPNRKT